VRTLAERVRSAPAGSYTKKLLDDSELLRAKLHEEVDELMDARDRDDAIGEAVDVLYFALVRAVAMGVRLEDVDRELDLRARRVTRRSATETNSTSPRGAASDVTTKDDA
jgi:phosphoribosyl-ATP pyrophosphohydrolase/phosphoribosyl-AMP cyclohydrolase/histidinol dehydrogenase